MVDGGPVRGAIKTRDVGWSDLVATSWLKARAALRTSL